jgi:glycosyltransferase involved in cell wall biosynthesis
MWQGQRVSVVLMTYAERDSIRSVIEGFYETGVVDEVLVVNNNAQQGTVEEVEETPARQVFERQQGYGHASRRGLQEAEGDLIVLAEPDGTFLPSDIFKLLVFSEHCDAVFGTRTTRELIWHGANMRWSLRWGNWAVAKLVEVLFNTTHLSDVGCTYRLFRSDLALEIAERMRIGGNHAGPEMMLLAVTSGARFVEIPVNYLPRVGTSSATGRPLAAIAIGIRMIGLILRFRARTRGWLKRPEQLGVSSAGPSPESPPRSRPPAHRQ